MQSSVKHSFQLRKFSEWAYFRRLCKNEVFSRRILRYRQYVKDANMNSDQRL
jgi:hypothetical protein